MKKWLPIFLLLTILLGGCQSFVTDTHLVVEKHSEQPTKSTEIPVEEAEVISNRSQLRWAVLSCISNWAENSALTIENYEDDLEHDLSEIITYATQEYPIGAYAVDFIDAELNGDAKQGTIALSIVFRRSAAEIKSIVTIGTTSAALRRIEQALRSCQSALTFRIREYDEVNFDAAIGEYCLNNPNLVPAIPEFSAEVYPPTGETRILELHFTYPDTRESLQMNLASVNTILSSATSYIQAGEDDLSRVSLLARFLTTRFDYRVSDTAPSMPAYELLCRGVAHSLSFASIFRYECEKIDVECHLVSGTKNDAPHYWNIVRIDDVYYHVDLMNDREAAKLVLRSSQELLDAGYLWSWEDYPEVSLPTEASTEETAPTEPTESSQSADPTEPSESTDPTEPSESTDPTEPPEPTTPPAP